MFEVVDRREQRDVAVTSSAATAEFVAATLAVHGIQAATAPFDRAYPSVSWAQGYRVVVAAEDEAAAGRVLADLSRDDVIQVLPADEDEG